MDEHAPKNIVLCMDGTGNIGIKGRGTNVFKLFEAVDIHGHRTGADTPRQVAYYSDGVGTAGGKVKQIVTQAFGSGLVKHVKKVYLDLVRVYRPGDHIFIFGFSRGAFSARTLGGFIDTCGILKLEPDDTDDVIRRRINAAYQIYVSQSLALLERWKWAGLGDRVEARLGGAFFHEDVPIRFIGVWDTVAALGFPIESIANWWNKYVHRFKFPHHDVPPKVECARHAIAIDEQRTTFQPTLWREQEGDDVEQVWFAGVHSNIGGGYPKQGMSLVTLDWMMAEAEKKGLQFIPELRELYQLAQNVHDKLYDPRAGFRSYYRFRPRDIAALCAGQAPIRIHESVLERIYLGTDGYAPGNLPYQFQLVTYRDDWRPLRWTRELASQWARRVEQEPLLTRAGAWVFRRKTAWFGMFVGTLLIFAELGQDAWLAIDERVKTGLNDIWHAFRTFPSFEGVRGFPAALQGWVESFSDVVFGKVAALVVLALQEESLRNELPQVLASVIMLVIAALLCYGMAQDARRRMDRLFAKVWLEDVLRSRRILAPESPTAGGSDEAPVPSVPRG